MSYLHFDDDPTNIDEPVEMLTYVVAIYGSNGYMTSRKAFLRKYSAWKYIEQYYNGLLEMDSDTQDFEDFNIKCVKYKIAPMEIEVQLDGGSSIVITMSGMHLSLT